MRESYSICVFIIQKKKIILNSICISRRMEEEIEILQSIYFDDFIGCDLKW